MCAYPFARPLGNTRTTSATYLDLGSPVASKISLPFGEVRPLPVPSLDFDEAPLLAAEPLDFLERRSVPWLIMLADVCAAQLALALGVLARQAVAPWLGTTIGKANYQGIVLGLLTLPLANCLMGLYPGYGLGPVERLRRRVIAASVTFTALIVWDSLVLKGEWSRGIELFSFAFALVLSPLVEAAVAHLFMRYRWWGTPVIVLSSDNAGSRIRRIAPSQAGTRPRPRRPAEGPAGDLGHQHRRRPRDRCRIDGALARQARTHRRGRYA